MAIETTDYGLSIPESDQEFVILPDKTKVRFESTGPLMKYLEEEIAAWRDIDYPMCMRYDRIHTELRQIIERAGEDGLKQGAINNIRSSLCAYNSDAFDVSGCIHSQSRLGKLLAAYRAEFRDDEVYRVRASAAFCVAMRIVRFGYRVDGTWALAVADAVTRFRGGDALADDISGYRRELESLSALGVKQRTDYDNRIADFEAKKAAFDADRKKQFEDDNAKFAEHLKAADDSAEEFKQKYQERIKVLEDTFSKKVQLEEPAKYWDKLAKSYRNRGWLLLFLAFALGIVAIDELFGLLLENEHLKLFNAVKFDFSTIRASLMLIVGTSIIGYLLHLFTRLAISSFHLARDYRERFQLTCVYLSLLKYGDIKNDENTRQIVLQSIFSRSDTGLLKGDHALTMPVAAIGELAKS